MGIKRAYWAIREELREWRRYLIFAMPGRIGWWARARYLRKHLAACGTPPKIGPNVWIANPEKAFFGNNVAMSKGTFITAGGGVHLHDNVTIGPDSKIWSVNHAFEDPDTPVREQGWEYKEVVIEADVWLGANCIIKPGVTIGRGAILSAGTILSKSVPAYSIVAGNPGRVVGWRKRPDETPPSDGSDAAPAPLEKSKQVSG